jgi:hypothetical protein
MIALLRGRVAEIVREVGADHEKRALIQRGIDDRCDLRRFDVAREQRNEGEPSKHGLQEG